MDQELQVRRTNNPGNPGTRGVLQSIQDYCSKMGDWINKNPLKFLAVLAISALLIWLTVSGMMPVILAAIAAAIKGGMALGF